MSNADILPRHLLFPGVTGVAKAATRVNLTELARRGAAARVAELRAELAELLRAFPGLRTTRSSTPTDALSRTKRKARRAMSAAQRKAVSQRMTKYWAARRKAKKS
jgi:hypothetical protein